MSVPLRGRKPDGEVDQTAVADIEIVRRARQGDAEAFGQLVRTHQRRVVSVAYRLLGNMQDAYDASQDAFVRAFRSLGQLDDPARFGSWLMRIACNQALNLRRGRSVRQTLTLESIDSERKAGPGGAFPRSLEVEHRDDAGALPMELRSAMDDAIAQLPEKHRLALILFSVEGLPQAEVAAVLECTVELVKWYVFQARKKLRVLLADYLS